MYAIVKTGGKQYRVEAGRTLEVERLPGGEGETVELGDVLMIAADGNVTIGTPTIEGARVLASVESHGRAPKIVVFKYKSKVRSRKKTGHRQGYTRLTVEEILAPGQEAKAAPPKRREEEAEAELAEEAILDQTVAVEVAEPVVAAEKPAPKPRASRAAATAEKKPAKASAAKRKAKAEKAAAKPKAEKPAAKAKAPAKAEEKPKAARRRLPIGRKKKDTE